ATVREAQSSERRFCFELVTPVNIHHVVTKGRNSNEFTKRRQTRTWNLGFKLYEMQSKVHLTDQPQLSIFFLLNPPRTSKDIPLERCSLRGERIEELFLDHKKQGSYLL